jgi:hypothetical protein
MKEIIGRKVEITKGYWKGMQGVIVKKHKEFNNYYIVDMGDEYITMPIIHALDMEFI